MFGKPPIKKQEIDVLVLMPYYYLQLFLTLVYTLGKQFLGMMIMDW